VAPWAPAGSSGTRAGPHHAPGRSGTEALAGSHGRHERRVAAAHLRPQLGIPCPHGHLQDERWQELPACVLLPRRRNTSLLELPGDTGRGPSCTRILSTGTSPGQCLIVGTLVQHGYK
jgi:hypothetical protein